MYWMFGTVSKYPRVAGCVECILLVKCPPPPRSLLVSHQDKADQRLEGRASGWQDFDWTSKMAVALDNNRGTHRRRPANALLY